ncbi:tanabin-like [Paralichthys olivaceus]|uniref:tanabin-like n=1 Tax=Paralichthys olivaceus TaxID=8255 RepID=UPI0037507C80
MMEFWPEHQGQSSLYAKFGTVPGRNCTHNYHDRHHATHSPFYYGTQQDQGREASYWTVPGSRTGGGLHDYTNWTNPELSAQTSSHFPFILDRHTRQHQGLGEYQPHEARGREWISDQRVAREYDRGFLREGWQGRWEPSNPVRYNREVSTKRSDSSYRELEAWAARYSHSLPRRRNREAELRGTSHVLLESSRAPERRSVTDPQVAVLQQVRQSASIRESGAWDRGGRLQTPNYYPLQAPVNDTKHMLDSKEQAGYQRRVFSQPPGYIAPPPYDSPHKSSPVIHHCDTSCGQKGMQQHYWSQPTLRKEDACVDVQDKRKVGKEDFTKPDVNEICAELERLEQRGPGTVAVQGGIPFSVQSSHMQHECMSSLQQPQLIQAVQDTKTNEQTSSKVIEGRKFRLNKKTGGLTIFCLVSRISGTTETPSLPLCTSQGNIQSTEFGERCKDPRDNGDMYQTQKLADEVDFIVPTLTEQSNTSDGRNVKAKQKTTSACIESEMFSDNLSKKTKTGENNNLNDANSTFGRQVTQPVHPVSVKYPLWREPSFTSRAETDSSSTVLKANSEEVESDDAHNLGECAPVHPVNVEVRTLDIKKDTQSEDTKGLLVIDTTCVVVKMELIPSPKKDHVHYLGSAKHTDDSPLDSQSSTSAESNSQLNQDVLPNPLQINDRAEIETESDFEEEEEPEGGGDISLACTSSSSISERETLQERAERILGIPLHECITEEQQDATSLIDSCVEKCDEEVEPSPIANDIHDATEQLLQDTQDEERFQNHLEMDQIQDSVDLQESYEEEDQAQNEDGKHFVVLQRQVSDMSEERDTESQLETNIKTAQEDEMAEENLFEQTHEDSMTEQSQAEDSPVENDPSQHLSQCFSPCKDLSDYCLLPHPNLTSLSSSFSQSSTEEGLNPQLAAFCTTENLVPHPETSSLPDAPSQQPSPLPPAPTESSPSSTPHRCHSPSPSPPPDLIDQVPETMSSIEDHDEEGDTLQLVTNDMSDLEALGDQQRLEYEQPHNAPCVEESNSTDEQQAKEVDREITDILEQCLEMSRQNAAESNILQQQSLCVQAEECACIKESHVTDEQQQEQTGEDPAELLEITVSQENIAANQSQAEVEILPQQFDNGQEDTSYGTESYMTAESNILQQQSLCVQAEECACIEESHLTDEQQQEQAGEDPAELLEMTKSQENMTADQSQAEVEILPQKFENVGHEDASYGTESYMTAEFNILQQQSLCVQAEECACIEESHLTDEQQQEQAGEDPAELLEMTKSQENMKADQSQAEVEILPQQFENVGHEDASYGTESYMTAEQLLKDNSEYTDLLVQTSEILKDNMTDSESQEEAKIVQEQYMNVSCVMSPMTGDALQIDVDEEPSISHKNATDNQTRAEIEIEMLQDVEAGTEPSGFTSPSTSDSRVSQSPPDVLLPSELPSSPHASHKSNTEPRSPLEVESALNPVTADVGLPETVSPALHLDSCEESPQLSSSSIEESAQNQAPLTSTPPHEGVEDVSFDQPHKALQYPKSLWDAVNRIRKHTAPDSENEEEEVSEQWDPESTGGDLGCLDVVFVMNSGTVIFDNKGRCEVSTGSFVDVEQDSCDEESSMRAEEDTLSCSSNSSHSSGDTIIVAEEDEIEEMPPGAVTESKTESEKRIPMAEGERCCCSEVKDETADDDEGAEELIKGDKTQLCLSGECSAEGETITVKAMKITEMEQEEVEEEDFPPSEVTQVDTVQL